MKNIFKNYGKMFNNKIFLCELFKWQGMLWLNGVNFIESYLNENNYSYTYLNKQWLINETI